MKCKPPSWLWSFQRINIVLLVQGTLSGLSFSFWNLNGVQRWIKKTEFFINWCAARVSGLSPCVLLFRCNIVNNWSCNGSFKNDSFTYSTSLIFFENRFSAKLKYIAKNVDPNNITAPQIHARIFTKKKNKKLNYRCKVLLYWPFLLILGRGWFRHIQQLMSRRTFVGSNDVHSHPLFTVSTQVLLNPEVRFR